MSTVSSLRTKTDDELQSYSFDRYAWSQFDYRIELARRLADIFNADHVVLFDDVAMVTGESERLMSLSAIQGCDRSLLPALWLATGFEYGATILVYAPPNPIELREFLSIRRKFEEKLQRKIPLRIMFNELTDLLALYEQSQEQYTEFCLKYMTVSSFRPVFTNEYFIEQLKINANEILDHIQTKRRTLVFPFEVTPCHVQELTPNKRLILPDLPTNDKAKHNFLLRRCGFTKLPQLFMISVDGTIIDSSEEYEKTIESVNHSETKNTLVNVERFAHSIIEAIDRLSSKYGLCAFVKLDALGAGGWSNIDPKQHSILYDSNFSLTERSSYLINYITTNIIDQHLPTHAVVEEYIEAELRPGDILADYTVCGLLLNGKFFPTSINLCGTDNGQYIEQWTASNAEYLHDQNHDWRSMFETYKELSELESKSLNYSNGIYAGDLFISKKNREHKQRDWNIRRGGRSTPETLMMIDEYEVNYECKVILDLNTISNSVKLSNEQIFHLYTYICDELSKSPYNIYPFSTGYVYFGQSDDMNEFLKFNFILNPRLLVDNQENPLPKSQHRDEVYKIVRDVAYKYFLSFVNSKEKDK